MNEVEKMLDWVEFVTDKFAANHVPWKYSRDTGKLKHIRYESDYTGYNHWTKRLKRFLEDVTIDFIRPNKLERQFIKLGSKRNRNWFLTVRVAYSVLLKKDNNLPDGVVDGNITFWEEDGEYITMFCPYVGREVLKFLKEEQDNPYAQNIINAMLETQEASWPRKGKNVSDEDHD